MKNQNRITKKLLSTTLVISLIQMQTLPYAHAGTAEDIGLAISTVGNIGAQILNNKAQIVQQQMSQAQIANIQKQLQPKLNVSKYFPECQLPASMQNMPQNVCMPTNNPNQLSTMYGYEAAANNMMNFYDQMLNEATSVNNVGMACLNNRKKGFDSQMTEMINNLTRLQTQLKEESQAFRENNKKLISDLEETNAELMGTSDPGIAKNSMEGKARDFTKMVSPTCQKVLGNGFSETSERFGFNGLLKTVAPKNRAANDFSSSKAQIESEIRSQANVIKDSINEVGLENWAAGLQSRSQINIQDKLSSFKGFNPLVEREKAGLQAQKSRIANEINSLAPGFQIPTGGRGNSGDLQKFINGSQDYFKKKFVNDCTVNSSKGVAIDLDKVLGSIEQLNTENSPAAISGYKQALSNILSSDDYISDKLAQIKELEKTYVGMTVTYSDSTGSSVKSSPYELLAKTESACNAKYSDSQTFSKTQANGLSEDEKAKKVQGLLQEYKNLSDNFASKLSNNIISTLINCNGESLKATDKCDETTIDPAQKGDFCIAKASTCANNMLACYTEVNTQVEKRKTKINNISKQFNANVETMVNRANALYKQQSANVTALTKLIQQKFPGSNFEIPKDMFIPLPETKKDKYGVEMAMDGDINKIIAMLPEKIETLKQMFGDQKEAAGKEIDDYIGKQREAMAREKSRFQELASKCTAAAETSAQNIARANKEGQDAQAKKDQAVGDFCEKYSLLSENPSAGCDEAKTLYTDIAKVNKMLDPNVRPNVTAFKKYCDSYMGESDSDSGKKKKKKSKSDFPDFKKMCIDNNTSAKDNNDEFLATLKNSNPVFKNLKKEDWAKVKDYILKSDTSSDSLPDSIKDLDSDDTLKVVLEELQKLNKPKNYEIDQTKFDDNFKKVFDKLNSNKSSICARLSLEVIEGNKADFEKGSGTDPKFKKEDDVFNVIVNKENTFKEKIKTAIAEYNQSESTDASEIALSSLGEKIKGTSCVANSNSTIGKNPFAFDLNSYDQGKLGASGASR
jgi:hypothetical protein